MDESHEGSKIPARRVDGPHKDKKLQVYKVDEHHYYYLFKPSKWTDIRRGRYLAHKSGRPLKATLFKKNGSYKTNCPQTFFKIKCTDSSKAKYQQNDKNALIKSLNKRDKMSTKQIQLNPIHNGQNLIVLKILSTWIKKFLSIRSNGVFG